MHGWSLLADRTEPVLRVDESLNFIRTDAKALFKMVMAGAPVFALDELSVSPVVARPTVRATTGLCTAVAREFIERLRLFAGRTSLQKPSVQGSERRAVKTIQHRG